MNFHWSDCSDLRAVDFAPYQLVSLDIFDTVLHRAVKVPTDLFKELARSASAKGWLDEHLNPEEFALLRIEMERKARQLNKLTKKSTEVTFSEIWQQAPSFLNYKAELSQLELDTELSLSFPNPYLLSLIEHLRQSGKELIFTSDTYFPRQFIKELFAKAQIDVSDKELLLSNEEGTDKASGKLFLRLLALFPQHHCGQIMHLGDNLVSDGIQPQSQQICSLYLGGIHRKTEDEQRQLLLGTLAQENPLSTLYRLGQSGTSGPHTNFFRQFGASLYGPVLASFCYWLAADAQKRQIRLICPIMREAQVLVPLIQQAVTALGSDIEVRPLYTSRKAAFLPAMRRLDKDAINHFYSRRYYSLQHLIKELTLPEPDLCLLQYASSPLAEIPLQDQLNQYLQSEEVQRAAIEASRIARQMFCLYIREVFADFDSVAMVDLGPKGNTLSWLSDCLEDNNPIRMNYLMYSMPELAKNALKGVAYSTYFPVRPNSLPKLRMIHRCPEPLEILLTGRKRTTIGYSLQPDGTVSPVTNAVFFDQQQDNKLAEFEQGCMLAMQHLCFIARYIPQAQIVSSSSREAALDELNALLELPSQTEAQQLGALLFDDNAGSDSFSSICTEQDLARLRQNGPDVFMYSARQQWGYLQSGVRWPQAVVASIYADFLIKQRLINFNDADFQLLCFNLVARAKELEQPEVIIYGGGKLGHQMVETAEAAGLTILAVVDSNKSLHGLKIRHYPIVSLEEAALKHRPCYLVASVAFAKAIVSTIEIYYQSLPQKPLIVSIAPMQS